MAKKRMDPDERSRLGSRARQRREFLGLTRKQASEQGGFSSINLLNWEKCLPLNNKMDHSWERVLQVTPGWLRDPDAIVALPESFCLSGSAPADGTFVDRMRQVFCWYVRSNPNRRTTNLNALTQSEKRIVEIMLQRYGVLGERSSTLFETGKHHGVTRERVRQIIEKATAHFGDNSIPKTIIQPLQDAIAPHLPCSVSDLDIAVKSYLGGALSIEGAERFAREVLGYSIVRLVSNTNSIAAPHARIAVGTTAFDEGIAKTVRQLALAMIRASGAAHVLYVTGAAAESSIKGITPQDVMMCCQMSSTFEWLVEEDGWFWFGPVPDNRVRSCAMKVLRVATRNVDIEEIYGAITRARVQRYQRDKSRPCSIIAPLTVVQAILARCPEIRCVQSNDFYLAPPANEHNIAKEPLSDTEVILRDVLIAHAGVASRRTLVNELVAKNGVVLITLNMVLDGSPIVRRLDKGIWGLVGWPLNLDALAEARAQSIYGPPKVYTPIDGWREFDVRVPASAYDRKDWFVPAAMTPFLSEGTYEVENYDDPAIFVSTQNGNPTLRRFVTKLIAAGIVYLEGGTSIRVGIHGTLRRLRFEALPALEPSNEIVLDMDTN